MLGGDGQQLTLVQLVMILLVLGVSRGAYLLNLEKTHLRATIEKIRVTNKEDP